MATSGYSQTSLLKKLGIREEMKVMLLNTPEDYFDLLSKDISLQFCGKKEKPDFIHLFVKSEAEFVANMQKLENKILPTTIIWVSWYKKIWSGLKLVVPVSKR